MPSMAPGLHLKLPANEQSVVSLTGMQPALLVALQFVVFGFFSPFPTTVIPAPSYAPISVGSCSSSARLPFRSAVQPISGSSGIGSTCACCAAGHV